MRTEPNKQNMTTKWPEDGIESIDCCPVCGCGNNEILYRDLIDIFFGCAPGKWSMCLCAECGASFLNPRPTKETIHLAYKNYYTHDVRNADKLRPSGFIKKVKALVKNCYLKLLYRSPAESFMRRVFLQFFFNTNSLARRELDRWVRNLPVPERGNSRLLDIGCGNGYFMKIAERAGWDPLGIDFDKKALVAAKAVSAEVICCNVYSLPFGSDSIDYITINHVIEHLHEPLAALVEIRRVLKQKGSLWIATPNINSAAHYSSGNLWRGLEPPRHLIIYTFKALESILMQAGFCKVINKSVFIEERSNWELVVIAQK